MGVGFITRRGGSGGWRLKVIAVENEVSLPITEREGTIAVITSMPIGEVLVQNQEPESPSSGDVWVSVDIASFATVKIKNITIYPATCKQYINNEWVVQSAWIYTNGSWLEMWANILFDSGEEYI